MARELYLLPSNGAITGEGPGWVYYKDSVYDNASRLSITSGTRTLFSVDGLGSGTETSYRDTLPTDLWDSNTINPSAVGEAYSVRMGFEAAPTVTGDGYIEVQLDIGSGSEINIVESRLTLQKGSGVTHKFSYTASIFCLTTFNTNGGKIYLTPSINCEIWDKNIYLQRTYSP